MSISKYSIGGIEINPKYIAMHRKKLNEKGIHMELSKKEINQSKLFIANLRKMFIGCSINGFKMDDGFDTIEKLICFAEQESK